MGKNKDKNNRAWIFYALVTLLAVTFLFVKRNNVIRWVQAGITVSAQEKSIGEYKRRIEDMDRQLKSLGSNVDTLESFARENFFFSMPGEDVYLTGE